MRGSVLAVESILREVHKMSVGQGCERWLIWSRGQYSACRWWSNHSIGRYGTHAGGGVDCIRGCLSDDSCGRVHRRWTHIHRRIV